MYLSQPRTATSLSVLLNQNSSLLSFNDHSRASQIPEQAEMASNNDAIPENLSIPLPPFIIEGAMLEAISTPSSIPPTPSSDELTGSDTSQEILENTHAGTPAFADDDGNISTSPTISENHQSEHSTPRDPNDSLELFLQELSEVLSSHTGQIRITNFQSGHSQIKPLRPKFESKITEIATRVASLFRPASNRPFSTSATLPARRNTISGSPTLSFYRAQTVSPSPPTVSPTRQAFRIVRLPSIIQIPGFRERTPSVIRALRQSSRYNSPARERTPSAIRALRPRYQRYNEWDPVVASQNGLLHSTASSQIPHTDDSIITTLPITSQGNHGQDSSTGSIISSETAENNVSGEEPLTLGSPTRAGSRAPSSPPESRGRGRRRGFRQRTPSAIRALHPQPRYSSCTRIQTPSPIRALKPNGRGYARAQSTYSIESSRGRSLPASIKSFTWSRK